MDDATRTFERLRPRLKGIARRLLGSETEAELVVQRALLRWQEVAPAEQDRAEAWLITTVTRLCLHHLRRLAEEGRDPAGSRSLETLVVDSFPATPEQVRERTDDVSVSFLISMERLTPETRTAFVLREMFGVDYGELARMVGKSEAECRRMVQHAKARLRDVRPRHGPAGDARFRLLRRFARAVAKGDMTTLSAMLSDNAELTGDGSGEVLSFGVPLKGGHAIAQLFLAAASRHGSAMRIELAMIDGQWRLLFRIDGVLESIHSYEIAGERIALVHVQREPGT